LFHGFNLIVALRHNFEMKTKREEEEEKEESKKEVGDEEIFRFVYY
jgi:hypothetical protein